MWRGAALGAYGARVTSPDRRDRLAARKRRIPARRPPSFYDLFGGEPPSSLDPMRRIEVQGQMLRDAKHRLRDPATPRRVRWGARAILAMVLAPFVVSFVALLVAQVASLF